MQEIKAPNHAESGDPSTVEVFLAGSIDMGEAEKWQDRIVHDIRHIDNLNVFNPRRDDWDSSWLQDPTPGTRFNEQVTWELDHIARADFVFFYFGADSKAPVTMAELGYCVGQNKKMIIFCPPEFYRHGNVVLLAQRSHSMAPIYHDYDEWKNAILQTIIEAKRAKDVDHSLKRMFEYWSIKKDVEGMTG